MDLGNFAAVKIFKGTLLLAEIIYIPIFFRNLLPMKDRKIRVYEGAKNNLPDEHALHATKEITKICQVAGENDLVIALISGGKKAVFYNVDILQSCLTKFAYMSFICLYLIHALLVPYPLCCS